MLRPAAWWRSLAPALIVAAAASCSDYGMGPPDVAGVEIVSGDAQSGPPGVPLVDPVVARVVDSGGNQVAWGLYVQIVSGDGAVSVPGRNAAGNGAVLASTTTGEVTASWSPGATGAQQLRFFAVRSKGDTLDAVATATGVTGVATGR